MLKTFNPISNGELLKEEIKLQCGQFDNTRGKSCLVTPELSRDEIIKYRKSLGMTQKQFSNEFSIPLGTLRRWEQGQNKPNLTYGSINLFSKLFTHKEKIA